MNNLTKLVGMAALMMLAIGIVTTTTIQPAQADKSSGQQGVDRAHESIHDSEQSQANEGFHRGTDAGGFE